MHHDTNEVLAGFSIIATLPPPRSSTWVIIALPNAIVILCPFPNCTHRTHTDILHRYEHNMYEVFMHIRLKYLPIPM